MTMDNEIDANYISLCFYEGKYKNVIDLLGRTSLRSQIKSFELITVFQLGALVFLGDVTEALLIFEQSSVLDLSPLFRVRCQFFLGIGMVRKSEYKKAHRFFIENILVLRKRRKQSREAGEEIAFYAFQGLAFFKFYRSQFQRSLFFSRKAYENAFKINFIYGQVLSLDLIGHSECNVGQVSRGLFSLSKALNLSKELGHGGISTAIEVSILKYQSQFGLNLPNTIPSLNRAIQSLAIEDTYSRAELYLELVRQLLIRGRSKEAQSHMEKIAQLIYRHQNKRQSAIFNLRFAYLLLLRGEFHAALALTTSLRFNLDSQIDILILKQADGLAAKISSLISPDGVTQTQLTHHKAVNFIDHRILKRTDLELDQIEPSINVGEDPLGDIIDRIAQKDPSVYIDLKKWSLHGFLPRLFNLPVGWKGLHFGPHPGDLVVVDGGQVTCIEKGVTSKIKKLAFELVGPKFKSKQYLVETVWGYSYNPEIHDRLIHATIGKLRKLIEPQGQWIEWSNDGYRILIDVRQVYSVSESGAKNIPRENFVAHSQIQFDGRGDKLLKSALNFRQIRLLENLTRSDFIGVKKYSSRYKISTMTACRDLTALHQAGYLVRVGQGRATVYRILQEEK